MAVSADILSFTLVDRFSDLNTFAGNNRPYVRMGRPLTYILLHILFFQNLSYDVKADF